MPTCFNWTGKEQEIEPQQLTKEQTQNQHLVPTGTPPGGTYVQIKYEIKNVNINNHKLKYGIQVYTNKTNKQANKQIK